MRILLVLGNAAETGGGAKYAKQLQPTLTAHGHTVTLVTYAGWLWRVPFGLRHILFVLQLLPSAWRSDVMLGFDTMTVGMPMWLASKLSGTPYAIRVGGDFVWEQFVESTGRLVKLSKFYQTPDIPLKQRIEIWLTGIVTRHASALLFNSRWQRDLWHKQYGFNLSRTYVVENLYPPRKAGDVPAKRVFVAAGRAIKLKQESLLRSIFEKLQKKYPDIELDTQALPPAEHANRVARSYALVLSSVSDVAPNVVIDALMYGKPFVCTDDTGIRERLEGTGLFVDTSSEQALSDAIESLMDPVVYAEVESKVKAFDLVRTWDDVANDVERVLADTI